MRAQIDPVLVRVQKIGINKVKTGVLSLVGKTRTTLNLGRLCVVDVCRCVFVDIEYNESPVEQGIIIDVECA